MRWLVVLALVACTHPTAPPVKQEVVAHQPPPPPPPPPPPDGAPAPDAGPPPSCPAAFKGLDGTACTADQQECSYPEGGCECENDMPCTGNVTVWKHAKEHPDLKWSCVVKVRPDGCPGVPPNRGWACTKEGQVCEYAQCISRTLSCHGGKWQLDKQGEPPP